jgi:DNA-binding NarL/FixJ family response regulator
MADGMKERDEDLFERLMADTDSDWPDRLLHDLAQAPLVEEGVLKFAHHYTQATREDLTDREVEILRYASVGLNADHIGSLLHLAEETVKKHLRACRFRLGAKNTTHACCLAIRQGLFE